jgi:hypothetical protein
MLESPSTIGPRPDRETSPTAEPPVEISLSAASPSGFSDDPSIPDSELTTRRQLELRSQMLMARWLVLTDRLAEIGVPYEDVRLDLHPVRAEGPCNR